MYGRVTRAFLIAYREMFSFAKLRHPSGGAMLAPFFVLPALVFSYSLIRLDRRISRKGLTAGMRWILSRYYAGVSGVRTAELPVGPIIFAGNHPGLGDLPALCSLIERDDILILAKDRSLTREMRGILSHCIVIDESLRSRARAIQQIMEALGQGKAVVLYPAGEIEPDPAVTPRGVPILRSWEPVIDALATRIRKHHLRVPVVPVYTEGVHDVPALFGCLLGSESTRASRAAIITMMSRAFRRRKITVSTGRATVLSSDVNPKGQLTDRIQTDIEDLRRITGALRSSSRGGFRNALAHRHPVPAA